MLDSGGRNGPGCEAATGRATLGPLLVGLWFPVCLATLAVLGRTTLAWHIESCYSAISWILRG
ncbi:hypothetical protein GCM10027299_11990 [Larkinella ripae]